MRLFGSMPYKKHIAILLPFLALILLTGCSSSLTGCSSNQFWYQEGKSPNQTMRDLAAYRHEQSWY
jgi:outer membrane biogenesis lipoprotein LolB